MKSVERYIYLIIIVILVAVIASGATYVVMKDKDNDVKTNENNNQNENENQNEDNSKTQDNITLSNDELEKYLSYVPRNDLLTSYDVYRTSSNLTKMTEIAMINNALRIKISEDFSDNIYTIDQFPEYTFEAKYSLNDIENLVYKMYNYKLPKLENVTIDTIGMGSYGANRFLFSYYNDAFYGWVACAECSDNHIGVVNEYQATNEELIIVEYGAFLVESLGDTCEIPYYFMDYQSDYKLNLPYKTFSNGTCSYEDINFKSYFNEHKNEFTKYKHTFKKNNAGYYWYSTEVV